MAVAEILNTVLGVFAYPKKVAPIDESKLEYLDGKTAHILFAVAEAVLGENFLLKAPQFIYTVDEYLAYQKRATQEVFKQALLLVEQPAFILLVVGKLRGFSYMSIKDRQGVFDKLRDSNQQLRRNLYAAFVNTSAATYYASPLTWPDIQYDGVSVDHPEILNHPPPIPWRPKDPRPIEK
jgi:hypothetical protein